MMPMETSGSDHLHLIKTDAPFSAISSPTIDYATTGCDLIGPGKREEWIGYRHKQPVHFVSFLQNILTT